jgi:hypothetical protein
MGGHRPRKLESEREWLLARHAREKDITLHAVLADLEAVRGVVVSCDTQWRFLRANGITFKKKRQSIHLPWIAHTQMPFAAALLCVAVSVASYLGPPKAAAAI